MIFLIVCSLGFLWGCGYKIQRPDTPICWLIYNDFSDTLSKGCYNIRNDYDDNGYRKKNAKPVVTIIKSLKDLDQHFITTAAGFVRSQAYLEKLKNHYK